MVSIYRKKLPVYPKIPGNLKSIAIVSTSTQIRIHGHHLSLLAYLGCPIFMPVALYVPDKDSSFLPVHPVLCQCTVTSSF